MLQSDTFSREGSLGWGTADTGGSWNLTTATDTSVNGSQGVMFLPRGSLRNASLGGPIKGPVRAVVEFSIPELPSAGEFSTGITLRRQGGSFYFARVRVDQRGDSFLAILAQPDGASAWALTPEVRLGRVAGGGSVTVAAGSDVDDALVTAAAWIAGTPQPDNWQVQAIEADLPTSGEVGLRATTTNDTPGLQVLFDNYEVMAMGANTPPVADFSFSADGLVLSVDGSASADTDGSIASYEWDFGDGSSATGAKPEPHTYAADGTYEVSLTVTDDLGAANTSSQELNISRNNAAPIADFTATIDQLEVSLDASGSTDSDGTIAGYRWDFGDGTPASTQAKATHKYAASGKFTVTLTVTDNDGATGSATQEVTVTPNEGPVAAYLFTSRGLRLFVSGKVSTDKDGSIVSWEWDFGDGTKSTGEEPAIKTYSKAGNYTVSLKVTDDAGATDVYRRSIAVGAGEDGGGGEAVPRGAALPIIYNLSELKGTKRFVAPNGSNETGNGSEAKPYRTLQKAVDVSAAGDSVVLRGGAYPIAKTSITKANITVAAYPGEIPVFDGSVAAPTAVSTEGALKWFAYQPVPARAGEGLAINQLPEAKFDSAGKPTGSAASRGWRCVSGSSYTEPAAVASGSGCPSGQKAYMIAGLYPDQVWVDGQHLTQVLDKSKVKKGTFFVPRTSASDAAPGAGRIYLSAEDAANMSKVRVSKSSDNFLIVQGKGVKIRGIKVENHSPAWPFFALTVTSNVDDFTAQDVEFKYVSSVATKVAGGDSAGGGGISDNPTFDRVTIRYSGWIGTSQLYTDNGTVSNSVITQSNYDREFNTAPKSGGIKATKTHGMNVVNSEISNNNGHGIWWDQSNYNATLANSDLRENSDSAVFYEISHGFTMVNNIVTRNGSPSSSPTIRLAGASAVKIVNNTIVGGQVPFALAGDPRSKSYGASNRLCSEHTERYRQGGSIASDCPPALSSDVDKARAGQFGSPNLTPGLNWRPSAVYLTNNVFANPIEGSGGICPGGYPVCIKSYAGSSSSPDVNLPPNQILPKSVIMNGNVYQSAKTVNETLAASGQPGGFKAVTLADLKGGNGYGSSFYGLTVEANGVQGTGFVTPAGVETQDFAREHPKAAPVPTDPIVNKYLAAGTKRYGAVRDVAPGVIPTDLPTAKFTATVSGNAVTVDGSGSTFDKGEIKLYAWYFGDSDPAGEATAVELGKVVEHVYDQPGTYTVTLIVVGSDGSFNYTQDSVTIADASVPYVAADTFTRLEDAGWADAEVGGPWTLTGGAAEKFLVDGEYGVFQIDAGKSLRAVLPGAKTADADLVVKTGTNRPVTGGGVYISAMPRVMADGSAYRAKVTVKANGSASVALTRIDAAGQETVIKAAASSTNLAGVTPGTPIMIRVQAVGTSQTTLKAKIWKDTDAEPAAWAVEATDSTAALQGAGGSGIFAYQSSSATAPIYWGFDDYSVLAPSARK